MSIRDVKKSLAMTLRRAASLLRPARPPLSAEDLLRNPAASSAVDRFHVLWYSSEGAAQVRWLGQPILKNPLDMWVYQEVLHDCRPDLIIETGTHHGASALFFACMGRLLGYPLQVVTIDINPKIAFDAAAYGIKPLVGISTTTDTHAQALRAVGDCSRALGREPKIMVVLDSDHSRDNVAEELRLYGPLVTPGQYLVVEDTNANGHPVLPEHGPGPAEAVEEFLVGRSDFFRDLSCEKFLMTFNPGGWLKRTGAVPDAGGGR